MNTHFQPDPGSAAPLVRREEKPGFCTLCRSRCGSLNIIENGRLVAVKPLPSHPTGKALCPKGRAAPEIVHNARRLMKPLRRTQPKTSDRSRLGANLLGRSARHDRRQNGRDRAQRRSRGGGFLLHNAERDVDLG